MWLSLILRNWQLLAIALLTAALTASMLHGRAVTAERDAKIAEIDSMRHAAQQYKTQSEQIAKEISDAHREHVLAAERNAFENAKRKFGTVARCPAVGLGTRGVLPTQHGDGETVSPGGTDVPAEEQVAVGREFINDCAFDASTVLLWQDWARRNQLTPTTD